LIHGLEDTVVPPSMSETYAELAKAAGDEARYVPLSGVGHRELIDPRSPAWDAISTSLEHVFSS
jgi:dipeptidyl aminopeptidase/acylaminoacyl peptidase